MFVGFQLSSLCFLSSGLQLVCAPLRGGGHRALTRAGDRHAGVLAPHGGGLYKSSNPVVTHSLKAHGFTDFNPCSL
jgi:hypothetical protein